MVPVMQTSDNCFSACLASLLGIPIERVPDFRPCLHSSPCIYGGTEWSFKVNNWLAGRGLCLLTVPWHNIGGVYSAVKPLLCMVVGTSPHTKEELHVVVGKLYPRKHDNGMITLEVEEIHDPCPAGGGIVQVSCVFFLVQLNFSPYGSPRDK